MNPAGPGMVQGRPCAKFTQEPFERGRMDRLRGSGSPASRCRPRSCSTSPCRLPTACMRHTLEALSIGTLNLGYFPPRRPYRNSTFRFSEISGRPGLFCGSVRGGFGGEPYSCGPHGAGAYPTGGAIPCECAVWEEACRRRSRTIVQPRRTAYSRMARFCIVGVC